MCVCVCVYVGVYVQTWNVNLAQNVRGLTLVMNIKFSMIVQHVTINKIYELIIVK